MNQLFQSLEHKNQIIISDKVIIDSITENFHNKSLPTGDIFMFYHQCREVDREKMINEAVIRDVTNFIQNDIIQRTKFKDLSVWKSEDGKTKINGLKLNKNIKSGSFLPRF